MTKLYEPIQIGSKQAKNRIFMAPMTRARATEDHITTPIMAEEGLGWPYIPGIWSEEQVETWKLITKAVHDNGGKIIVQLWHMGRAVHSSVTGHQPVSSSSTKYPHLLHTYEGKQESEEARPLTIDDIKRILKDYEIAAKNALKAGFDGVQIHGANGYLIDEFLRGSSNLRSDEYGGIVNRVCFFEEVVATVVNAIGSDKTSLRLSPNGELEGVIDSNP